MTTRIATICLAFLSSAVIATGPAEAQNPSNNIELRRFALVIGANNGGADRSILRFAQTDARSMARVVSELGGVSPRDIDLLLDPDRGDIDASFAALKSKLAAASGSNRRVELLVYYSGHSDEEGLLLAGKRYTYPDLRQQLARMPADVKIAILDSCASGAFTRTKGGVKRPAFVIDESSKVRGHAFLSSSSADEAAQESDRIGASFFTHYLVSGLRGGADSNSDGRVTLSEAYQFAFNETVSRTQATQHGAQHPAYDMHLVGTGDVVMTDLSTTTASLALAENVAGRLFIRDSSDRLILEMRKVAGSPVVLGLGPERYAVLLQRGQRWFRADIDLRDNKQVTLNTSSFRAFRSEATVARGSAPGAPSDDPAGAASAMTPDPTMAPAGEEDVYYVPFSIGLIPQVSSSVGRRTINRVAINLLIGAGHTVRGVELGGLANVRSHDVRGVQLAGITNINGGEVRGAQLAGIGNINGGRVRGAQAAGIGNVNGGYLRGVQLAGIGNWNGGFVRGIQAAGIGNLNDGFIRGGQLAGIANWSEGWVRGVQAAGIGNVANGDMHGIQAAGIFNVADGKVRGGQVGLVNVGGDVRGAQVGLVNVARRVRGVQLGLVNVAEEHHGVPIGLVSVVKNGHRALDVWTSDLAPLSVGFKFGARNFYSMLAVRSDNEVLMAGLGLGVHLERSNYYIDIDVTGYGILDYDFDETENDLLAEARAMVGFPIFGDISLFGGASMSGLLAFDGKTGAQLTPLESKIYENSTVTLRLSPGLFAGLSY